MENQFELIVRALIIKDKRILVCRNIGKDYFYLPGGHIEFLETMQDALKRELREELDARVIASQFLGGVENLFEQEGVKRHEFNFLFHVDIDIEEVNSKEEHLEFYWLSEEDFLNKNIGPPALKDAIIKWIADRKTFFVQVAATEESL